MGVPLIGAIYDNAPLVGLYTLPLLVWYPMQLVGGSSLTVKLLAFVHDEKIRLGIKEEEEEEEEEVDDEYDNEMCGKSLELDVVEEELSKESSSKRSWQRQQGLGLITEEEGVSMDNTSSKASKSGTRSSRRRMADGPSLVADTSITSRSFTRDYHSRADDSSDLSWWSELASLEFDVDSVRSFDIYRYPHRPTFGPGPDLDADDQPTRPTHDNDSSTQPQKPPQRGP